MEPKHERKVAVEYWYVSENQGGKLEIRLSNLDYMRIPRNPAWSIFDLHQVVPTRFPPSLTSKDGGGTISYGTKEDRGVNEDWQMIF